ncbi:MAG TPA: dienelactone hydrolase-related enzyme [Albidovulum sp.]|uniref:alpha/beta hydrolase family protein n=1 Tax=Albidovulum sp. TaxID=1872424 RepID=UPI002B87029E|nr:dienelactone hydrolase-related enzyme [Albidovulum sp.]
MYHRWLDHRDERRAARGDAIKTAVNFALDTELAFPDARSAGSVTAFCELADKATSDPAFFDEPRCSNLDFEIEDRRIRFPSDMTTDIVENNTVWARVTASGRSDRALVVFHHWNASTQYRHLAWFFARRGLTVFEIAMPYHFERSRPGASHADYMLSPSLGRTLQSMRQAVWDGRKLIRWLQQEGYREISVLGLSLGSWVAGLIAAHDKAVSKAALLLTAGSLADMVWTGRATRSIRESLEPAIDLASLRRAWGPVDQERHLRRLARPGLDLQMVLALRDRVVLPELSQRLLQGLNDVGATPRVLQLNCGHYSLSMPPYIFWAGVAVAGLLGHRH